MVLSTKKTPTPDSSASAELEKLEQDLDARTAVRDRRRWWRRPWMIPLAVLITVFLTYIWGPYIAFDPATVRVILVDHLPWHFALLMVHIVGTSVAMIAAFVQVWPMVRRRYPVVHRWVGRVYVVAVVAGSVAAVILMKIRNDRDLGIQVGSFGLYITAILWLVFTLAGYRMGRQRRWAEHRRWMIYSFALSMTNIYSRPIFIFLSGLDGVNLNAYFELIGWLPFIVHVTIAQWWLDRTSGLPWVNRKARERARAQARTRQNRTAVSSAEAP